jgi:asparagine synthase (glutamine-hydrolysing)
MCGICGIVHLDNKPAQEPPVREMMRAMKHRGPDDEGTYMKENVGLGFVRLSILDLSAAGHQPMVSNDGRYVVVMNGEIFNYIELKEELKGFYSFKSTSDTEVLLAAYMKWGEACLEKLNGMFAFAILDTLTNNLFAARDRFGIKPFYYFIAQDTFYFASDIPPLLKVCEHAREPEDSIIFDYLVFNRTNHSEKTFFKNILKLQHGHMLTVTGKKVYLKRWYNLPEKVSQMGASEFGSRDFFEELKSSINIQLRSDVPVGTCLSGGLDSSAITSLVLENKKDIDLHSFSAVYGKGQRGDESEYIAEYHDKNLKIHYTHPTDDSLLADLDNFIISLSEPVPTTSIYAEYKVMELAKQHCTVLLNGQGADELMAGYHYFYGYYFRDLLHSGSWRRFLNETYQYLKTHRSVYGLKSMGFSMSPRSLRHFKDHSHLTKEFYDKYYECSNSLLDVFYRSGSLKEFLINHFEYKFEHNLLWADKTGMQFSLETRFPFLDHNLVEKTLSIPTENYIKDGYTKVIMREALKGILPEKIRTRKDKIGFATPQQDWFRNKKFQAILTDVVESESFKNRGYFDIPRSKKDLQGLINQGRYNPEFWKKIHLELWFRRFID